MSDDPNTSSSKPPPAEPPPAPIQSGGLPGPWGRRLPLIMLAAGVIGIGLLVATSSDRPRHAVKIGTPDSFRQPEAQTPGATGSSSR